VDKSLDVKEYLVKAKLRRGQLYSHSVSPPVLRRGQLYSPYVVDIYSRIPVTRPQENEERMPPDQPCIWHGYVHIQGSCIHKTGSIRIE